MTLRILKNLNTLKDKQNLDVDLSYINYTPEQMERLNIQISNMRVRDQLEIDRNSKFQQAATLDLKQLPQQLPENPFMKTTGKPESMQPAQWREFVEGEIQQQKQAAYSQHQLDAALRQEKLRAMNASAISFSTPPNQQVPGVGNPTYKSDLASGNAFSHTKKIKMCPPNAAREALLSGQRPLEAKREKGYSEFQPVGRAFDIAQPGRKVEIFGYKEPKVECVRTGRLW